MHSELEQFLIVLSAVPTEFFHLFDVLRKHVRIEFLRVVGIELKAFLFRQRDDLRRQLTGQFTTLTEDHTPHSRIHTGEVFLTHRTAEEVHKGCILHVLAERGYQTRCTEHRPDTLYLVEQLHEQFVFAQLFLPFLLQVRVDSSVHTFEVRHQTSHHTARQTAAYKQTRHQRILRINPITEEIIDELLRQATCLHIGLHIDVFDAEAGIFEHRLNSDHIGMHLTPTERFHRYV